MKDLKVLINEETFNELQDYFLSLNIEWDRSGLFTRAYEDGWICLYYRAKTNTMQYGIRKYNFDTDNAFEVSVDEFKVRINNMFR